YLSLIVPSLVLLPVTSACFPYTTLFRSACAWTVVGNPAMMQLLCGLPVDGLGRAPFTPAYRAAIEQNGVYVGPLISGFVGADAEIGRASCRDRAQTQPWHRQLTNKESLR